MIRIYFEALEQGLFFLKPAVVKALGEGVEIQLVRLSRISRTSEVARNLMPSLGFKDPDAIITTVLDGVEIPLLWIEISTSVETQDHVLQRFDSQVASGLARIPFVKVQARRIARADHGGQTSFDFKETFQILFREFGIASAQLEWPITNDGLLAIRHEKFKACPATDLGLSDLISATYEGVLNGKDANEALLGWAKTNAGNAVAQEILENSSDLNDFTESRRSTRFFRSGNEWTLKFNRWGHAMDPERGMAWYYSKRLGKRLLGRLHDKEANTAEQAINNFRLATGIQVKFKGEAAGSSIDISDLVQLKKYNRSGLAIVANCSEFTICDEQGMALIRLTWDELTNPIPDSLASLGESTKLYEYEGFGEDEVTFVAATQIFPTNDIEVQSVSYPGAQGDFALMQGSGRAALRTYIDLIGFKHFNDKTTVVMVESKGTNSVDRVSQDTEKILAWRDEPEKRDLLDRFLPLTQKAEYVAGTAYPGERVVNVPRADELDFVFLTSRVKWSVWAEVGSAAGNLFNVSSGTTQLPVIYEY
ncbi:MAG: hypothetical protein RLZZ258_1248 [Actinomycetota bacterium]|jgi:hypothetical protein